MDIGLSDRNQCVRSLRTGLGHQGTPVKDSSPLRHAVIAGICGEAEKLDEESSLRSEALRVADTLSDTYIHDLAQSAAVRHYLHGITAEGGKLVEPLKMIKEYETTEACARVVVQSTRWMSEQTEEFLQDAFSGKFERHSQAKDRIWNIHEEAETSAGVPKYMSVDFAYAMEKMYNCLGGGEQWYQNLMDTARTGRSG